MKRDEKLRLLRIAYSRWIHEYPEEDIDHEDCHLAQIQANLGLPQCLTGLKNSSEATDL